MYIFIRQGNIYKIGVYSLYLLVIIINLLKNNKFLKLCELYLKNRSNI